MEIGFLPDIFVEFALSDIDNLTFFVELILT